MLNTFFFYLGLVAVCDLVGYDNEQFPMDIYYLSAVGTYSFNDRAIIKLALWVFLFLQRLLAGVIRPTRGAQGHL